MIEAPVVRIRVRTTHLKDTIDLYNDIQNGSLPSVPFVKPNGFVDGHPASSKLDLFEGFVKKIITLVQANPKLWADTAIFITFDEGGGYWDSGYVQALDYFGDGTPPSDEPYGAVRIASFGAGLGIETAAWFLSATGTGGQAAERTEFLA
jgi:hypothetical protein